MNEKIRLKENKLSIKINNIEDSQPSDTLEDKNKEIPNSPVFMEEEKKKSRKPFFVAAIVVFLLFCISAFIYIFLAKNSKSLFLSAINQEYNNFVAKRNTL